jgi:hypothetical protein
MLKRIAGTRFVPRHPVKENPMHTPTRFSPLGRLTRLLAVAAVLVVVPGASAVASVTSASATSASATYSLAGTGSSVPGGCLDCLAPMMDASGTATCSVCIAGKPTSGDFAITTIVQTFPPSPCKVKAVSGTLDMTWSDGTTSSATVSGKFRDSKSLSLSGIFSATDAVYPSDPVTILLSNFPPSPCLAATNPITGTLAISTP